MGYIRSLNEPNVELIADDVVVRAEGDKVYTRGGRELRADVVVLATGFKVRDCEPWPLCILTTPYQPCEYRLTSANVVRRHVPLEDHQQRRRILPRTNGPHRLKGLPRHRRLVVPESLHLDGPEYDDRSLVRRVHVRVPTLPRVPHDPARSRSAS